MHLALRFPRHLLRAYRRWQEDDGSLMAAAVAYYAALSFFPLMLVLIAGLGFALRFTQWAQDAQQQLLTAIGESASPEVGAGVATLLEQVEEKAALGGPLGLVVLLFAAAALFAHFERAFDRIWNVPSAPPTGLLRTVIDIAFYRLRAFLMLLGVGLAVIVVFFASLTLAAVKAGAADLLPAAGWVWWGVEVGIGVALNTGLFTLIYALLPKVTVRWTEALRGALLAAVLWEVGRLVLTAFLLTEKYSAYGVVGLFIAIMLWIYFAATVLFLGAEYVQVICRECNPEQTQK